MAQEEKAWIEAGTSIIHDVSASAFLLPEEQADLERWIAASWWAKWALMRKLAQPILQEFWGLETAVAYQKDVDRQPSIIELDIDEGKGEHSNAADSDFKE